MEVNESTSKTKTKKGTIIVALLSLLAVGGFKLLKGYVKWSAKHDAKHSASSDTEELSSVQPTGSSRVTSSRGTPTTAAGNTHVGSPVRIEADDPQWGNADAPVTLVQFGDLECPFCVRVESTLERIKSQYGPEKLRLIWKHNPLKFHSRARPLAEAGATVLALGGDFWTFRDLAYANWNKLQNTEILQGWATDAGVDAKDFLSAVEAKTYAAKVDRDLELGRALGVTGTPAFRINGKVLAGGQPIERFTEIIDSELAAADALQSSGVARQALSLELTKKNFTQPPAPTPPSPAEAAPADTIWKVDLQATDPMRGSKDALVTIVEWGDYQCPFTRRAEETLTQIEQKYGKDVRFVWKDQPMTFHRQARRAANLAHFARSQAGNTAFWRTHNSLLTASGGLRDEDLEGVSRVVGLAWPEALSAIQSGKYNKVIDASVEQALALDARNAPVFFINGRRLASAVPYETFEPVIEAALSEARRLLERGVPRSDVYRELMRNAKTLDVPRVAIDAPAADSPSWGQSDAPVVIQLFGDFQCPFTARNASIVKQVQQAYPKQVRIVWRYLPLPFRNHAALAAEAAHEVFVQQGNDAFWKFQALLLDNRDALEPAQLETYARSIPDVDPVRFAAALTQRTHTARIARDIAVAKQFNITGTPTFSVNGELLAGAQPFPRFQKAILAALKPAE